MKTLGVRLTKRQRFFIAEYQKDWNGSAAVIRAGYRTKHPDIMAWQLLRVPLVKETLQREVDERLLKLGVHAESVLRDRVLVAKSDVRSLFRADGTLKGPEEWTDEIAGAIAGFEVVELYEGEGENRRLTGHLKKMKLNDRNPAQHDLMKYLGLFSQKGTKIDGEIKDSRQPLPNLESASRIMYYIHLTEQRKLELENKKAE